MIGIIAANTNNSKGIAGINWHANVDLYDVSKLKLKEYNGLPTYQVGISKSYLDDYVSQASNNSEII